MTLKLMTRKYLLRRINRHHLGRIFPSCLIDDNKLFESRKIQSWKLSQWFHISCILTKIPWIKNIKAFERRYVMSWNFECNKKKSFVMRHLIHNSLLIDRKSSTWTNGKYGKLCVFFYVFIMQIHYYHIKFIENSS